MSDQSILVVDDDAAIRDVVVRTLTKAGYRVQSESDGKRALDLLEGSPARLDLLITDIQMPGLGGKELVVRLALKRHGLRILLISGMDDANLKALAAGGAIHFLAKPFTPIELQEKVKEVLAGPSSTMEGAGT